MKKFYDSPEMEFEKFTITTSVFTLSANPDTTDPFDPDTEF